MITLKANCHHAIVKIHTTNCNQLKQSSDKGDNGLLQLWHNKTDTVTIVNVVTLSTNNPKRANINYLIYAPLIGKVGNELECKEYKWIHYAIVCVLLGAILKRDFTTTTIKKTVSPFAQLPFFFFSFAHHLIFLLTPRPTDLHYTVNALCICHFTNKKKYSSC